LSRLPSARFPRLDCSSLAGLSVRLLCLCVRSNLDGGGGLRYGRALLVNIRQNLKGLAGLTLAYFASVSYNELKVLYHLNPDERLRLWNVRLQVLRVPFQKCRHLIYPGKVVGFLKLYSVNLKRSIFGWGCGLLFSIFC